MNRLMILRRNYSFFGKSSLDLTKSGYILIFFELGGHSITAIHLINQISKTFNTQISLRQFFMHPSIHELSKIIQKSVHKTYTGIKTAVRKTHYDLTPSQKGIWLLNELKGDTVGYNIFGAFELLGILNVSRLQKAFALIVKRHESLRTNFVKIDGGPKQHVNTYEQEFF